MESKDFLEAEHIIIRYVGEINKAFENTQSEWDLEEPKEGNNITKLYTDLRTQVERDELKILRVSTRCIFFGRTSSGKSTLINALLGGRILPSENGPVTNSFVEIMKSEDNEEFVIFPDNTEKVQREPIESICRINKLDPNKIADCSHVGLYYSVEKCQLLKDGVVLIDTPGIDSEVKIDSSIQEECSNADVLVLVVNSCEGLGESERRFLDDHKTMFSKFKILVVFNRWDKIKEERKDDRKKENINTATDYLNNKLNIGENFCEGRIFFISAKQWLNISANNNSDGRPMDGEFERFVKCLKENLEESRQIRKKHCDILKESLTFVKGFKEDLQKRLEKKFRNSLQHLGDLNDKIKTDVKSTFDDSNYDYFFHLAKKSVKMREEYLECFIKEYVCVMFESLLRKIEGTLNSLIDEYHKYIIKLLINFHRCIYINFSHNPMETETSVIVKNCVEINEIIKKHKTVTIIGSCLAGGALAAVAGATAGIMLPISTAIAAPILSLSGAAVGGGTFCISSKYAINLKILKRLLYKGRYKDQEKYLKKLWNKMSEVFIDTYNEFVEATPVPLETLGSLGTEDQLRVLEDLVGEFTEKWKYGINLSES